MSDKTWCELGTCRAAQLQAERDALTRNLEQAHKAAAKFSAAHSYGTDYDGESLPFCDPQDWHDFDLAFGIEVK